MSIAPFSAGSIASRRSGDLFVALRRDLDDLQRQLGTGKMSESYAGLGLERRTSLAMRARLSAMAGYEGATVDATLRVKVMMERIERLSGTAGELKALILPPRFDLDGEGRTSAQRTAAEQFKLAVDLLNGEVNGRYLFAGRASDTKPVIDDMALLMEGVAGRDGLKDLIAERKRADQGADGLGRLTTPVLTGAVGTTVSVSETPASRTFGFTIAAVGSSNPAAIAAARNPGPPAGVDLAVGGTPAAGDAVRITLGLKDGTETVITLTARSGGPASDGAGFQIGASPAATAANLRGALETALAHEARTTLAASAALIAANDFFAGSPGNPPRRILPAAGAPPASFQDATGFAPTDPGDPAFRDTVRFYVGDDAAGPAGEPYSTTARSNAPVRIDATQTVAIGARANEPAFRSALAGFAVLAAETFSTDPLRLKEETQRHAALTDRVRSQLSPGPGTPRLEDVTAELGHAMAAMQEAKERHEATGAMLLDAVGAVEDARPEEVAAAILALQTRLQASYQTTAILSRLSIVNFL